LRDTDCGLKNDLPGKRRRRFPRARRWVLPADRRYLREGPWSHWFLRQAVPKVRAHSRDLHWRRTAGVHIVAVRRALRISRGERILSVAIEEASSRRGRRLRNGSRKSNSIEPCRRSRRCLRRLSTRSS